MYFPLELLDVMFLGSRRGNQRPRRCAHPPGHAAVTQALVSEIRGGGTWLSPRSASLLDAVRRLMRPGYSKAIHQRAGISGHDYPPVSGARPRVSVAPEPDWISIVPDPRDLSHSGSLQISVLTSKSGD